MHMAKQGRNSVLEVLVFGVFLSLVAMPFGKDLHASGMNELTNALDSDGSDFKDYHFAVNNDRKPEPYESQQVTTIEALSENGHFNFIRENDKVVRIEPDTDNELPVRWFADGSAVLDGPYNVSVNGQELPVFWAGRNEKAYYVRFQVHSPPFELVINIDLPKDHVINLQPLKYRDDVETIDGGIRLKIEGEGARVIKIEAPGGGRHTPLIILAEPSKSWELSTGEGAFHDVSHLAGKGPDSPQTSALQQILDLCAESENGGVVYFGPGHYHTGNLEIGSNTQVFLAPGAVVYGQQDLDGYTDTFPNYVLLHFYNAQNSGLAGPGVLDGNGHIIQAIDPSKRVSIHLVRFRDSTNMYARDVMLRNSVAWTFHIAECNDVTVDGVRIIGDWGLPNVDGIDPDNSKNIVIENVFISCADDSVVIKTSNRFGLGGPTENVVVRDSVVMTKKTALKLGTESRADVVGVLFENIDVIHSARGIALWMRDGHQFANIVFRNIRMDLMEVAGESMSGEPFRLCIQDREGGGVVRDVLIENVVVSAPYRALFTGRENSELKAVTLRNVRWQVTPARIKTSARPLSSGSNSDPHNELPIDGNPLLVIHRAKDFVFENITIDWRQVQGGPWTRFVDIRESNNIRISDINHLRYPFGLVPPEPPPAPASMDYPSTSSTGRYTISWTWSATAEEYQLEASSDGGNTWVDIFIGDDTVFAATSDDGENRYRVRGINGEGPGEWRTGGHDCLVTMTSMEIWRRQHFDDP